MIEEIEKMRNKYKTLYYDLNKKINILEDENNFREYCIAQKDIAFNIWIDLETILIKNKLDNRK